MGIIKCWSGIHRNRELNIQVKKNMLNSNFTYIRIGIITRYFDLNKSHELDNICSSL